MVPVTFSPTLTRRTGVSCFSEAASNSAKEPSSGCGSSTCRGCGRTDTPCSAGELCSATTGAAVSSTTAGAGAGLSGRSLSSLVSTTPVARRTTTSGPWGRRRSGRRGLAAGAAEGSAVGEAASTDGVPVDRCGAGRAAPSARPRPLRGRSSRSPPRPAGMPSITSPNVGRGLRGPDPPNLSSLTSPETSCCRASDTLPARSAPLGSRGRGL